VNHRFVLAAVALLTLLPASAARAVEDVTQAPPRTLTLEERGRRLDMIRQALAGTLASFDKRLAGGDDHGNPTLRDLPNAAIAKLILGHDPKEAQSLLELAFAQQNMDESSPTYGSVPWQMGHPEISDLNSDEFTSQALGPILTLFGDKFSPEFTQEIHKHAKAFFAAMNRRNFKTPAYTNIYLMRATNMILLGEAVNDTTAAAEGYHQLDAWITYTKANGIHEFDSPTYYYVDLDCLSMGYALTRDEAAKRKFRVILDYFWTDIAANYFPQRGCISGANSRNYDFLHSWGGIDYALFTEGFRSTADFGRPDLEKALWLVPPNDKAYRVSENTINLAKMPNRTVRQRWDAERDHDRYQYLMPEFSISSSNGDYGQQDKQIAIEFASPKPLPVISVVADTFDSPYGVVRSLDSSGHSKPTHLKINPTIVQDNNAILALIDLDPPKEKKEFRQAATLATNVLLPAAAQQILANGNPITIKAGMSETLDLPAIVTVREGNAAAIIYVFLADGILDQSPKIELKADADGLKRGVLRLAIYHYAGVKKATFDEHSVRVGLLLVANRARTEGEFGRFQTAVKNAKIKQATLGDIWSVKAEVSGIALEAEHDMKKHSSIVRKAEGSPVDAHPLEINGDDVGARIWAALGK